LASSSSTSDFGKGWVFHLGECKGASTPEYDDARWEKVRLPHSFNAKDTFIPVRGPYRGPAWYRKRFQRPGPGYIFLRFDAVWGKVQVWLNGKDLGEHTDGLVGFELELTQHLADGENLIAIRVDNSHDPRVLPGKRLPDYNVYGGLCAEVWLVTKGPCFFPWRSLTITSRDVHESRARVDIVALLARKDPGARKVRAVARIADAQGGEVLRTGQVSPGVNSTFSFHGEIASPRLWSPDSPNLYRVEVSLTADGVPVDSQSEQFGIRSFAFDENRGFIINGKRVQLRGVNRHQDFPGIANVLSPRLNRRDAELIKEMGGNFVRTSHYPQHPSFLAACDELGIAVYEEICTWQFIGGKPFIDSTDAMMADMIRRDRNHPSIVLWGVMNEGRSKKMFDRLKQTALSLDPTRPTVYAENTLAEGVSLGTVFITDVIGINYQLESMDALHSAYPRLKMLVSEHTNAEVPRGKPDDERKQVDRIAHDLDIIEPRAFVAGSALWSMHDYGTDYEPVWPIQRSGILDEYRNPKEAFYMIAARWRQDPVVHIASDWNFPHSEGQEVEVRVYANCDTVELSLGGHSLGAKKGLNPTVWRIPYSHGTISAVGRKGNAQPVMDSMAEPGEATRIELTGPEGIAADGKDAACVVARVTDRDGNVVPSFQHPVLFKARGPVHLCVPGGNYAAMPTAGITGIVLRSTERRGKASVIASAEGLTPGRLSFSSQ